jgi:hypothetical protein
LYRYHQATASAGGDALVAGAIAGGGGSGLWGDDTGVFGFSSAGAGAGASGVAAAGGGVAGVGVGGDGFVTTLRLLCSAAQPYLAALHRWLEAGELSDPSGELFVAAGRVDIFHVLLQ